MAVHSALPLIHAGQIVKNFWFTFKDGEVVDCGAEQGKDVLTSIVLKAASTWEEMCSYL